MERVHEVVNSQVEQIGRFSEEMEEPLSLVLREGHTQRAAQLLTQERQPFLPAPRVPERELDQNLLSAGAVGEEDLDGVRD